MGRRRPDVRSEPRILYALSHGGGRGEGSLPVRTGTLRAQSTLLSRHATGRSGVAPRHEGATTLSGDGHLAGTAWASGAKKAGARGIALHTLGRVRPSCSS